MNQNRVAAAFDEMPLTVRVGEREGHTRRETHSNRAQKKQQEKIILKTEECVREKLGVCSDTDCSIGRD